MILAAGFGTRLKPFTDSMPKALVDYKGKPMIENVISKLSAIGVNEFVINTHHFAGQLENYFSNRNGEERFDLLYEKEILGTGGGIMNARKYLEDSENFFIYNADVDCDADLQTMTKFHLVNKAIATLAVKKRDTSRYILSDLNANVVGRTENSVDTIYKESKYIFRYGFCGIHLVSSKIFNYMSFSVFDIISFYMDMVKLGHQIKAFDMGDVKWKDLGKLKDLVPD
jgi:NDP-sugar pyrophosphorylase family protein